ncbi:hypothetical protein OBBRIDRAFT_808757, partial [Obba rivulosa]
LKRRRLRAVKAYKKKHGGLDLTPLLQTPWMTEKGSGWDTPELPEVKEARMKMIATRTGYTLEEMQNGIKILERRSLSFRASKASAKSTGAVEIFHELDTIVCKQELKKGCPPPASKVRVDLQRPRNGPPPEWMTVYPMMISKNWRRKFGYRYNMTKIHLTRHNPRGFASDYDTPEATSSESSVNEDENGEGSQAEDDASEIEQCIE